jgi:diadenosine tetraphosphate (Ap4A) HIT family hydrolase
MNCDFCDEFGCPATSRFAKIYAPHVINRIVAQRGKLVAMPTIGQLFPGSLLIMPVTHTETMASLSKDALLQLSYFISDLEAVISRDKPVIALEHGACCKTGGGCGIYHAHLHLVPIPTSIFTNDLLPVGTDSDLFGKAPSLIEGLYALRSSVEYLIVRDTKNQVRYIDSPSMLGKRYPSQYFRRRLTDLFDLDCSWDWRTYQEPEQYVFETINMFKDANVSLCK